MGESVPTPVPSTPARLADKNSSQQRHRDTGDARGPFELGSCPNQLRPPVLLSPAPAYRNTKLAASVANRSFGPGSRLTVAGPSSHRLELCRRVFVGPACGPGAASICSRSPVVDGRDDADGMEVKSSTINVQRSIEIPQSQQITLPSNGQVPTWKQGTFEGMDSFARLPDSPVHLTPRITRTSLRLRLTGG